ncbi:hypothetical protein HNR19_002166 [Nocardioides thalensis]|uniref:HNH nuclease domain-containing protein n=1 Tax=Nocardioides thalensis TaxID=1914755 RepID=A0A853C4I9_9ACTN|nr:HNH endonuclease signature motif containing protein [Nocardioides thalensis]NYJ01468.1 hypothetical protein [Nocardioides thalensis]
MDTPITAAQVRELTDLLMTGARPDDPEAQIDLISALEDLKSAACGAQAETAVAYDAARRSAEAAQGVSARRQGRGVAAEIALARKESPHRGQVLLGFAKTMCAETPHLLDRLKDGSLSEFRAMLAVRELSCLTAEDRGVADVELFASPQALEGLGTRKLVGKVKRLVCELDPAAVVRRRSNAESDRHVSLRPAPDTMAYLTALVPVAQGVSAYAALTREAATMQAAGDPRSKGQLMADLLVSRVTGVPMNDSETTPPAVPVGINVVMSDATLAGGNGPALVESETIPAEVARLLAAHALEHGSELDNWIRQLYADPSGRLVAMTSKQRTFPGGLAEFLRLKSHGICANPWCDAPVRHIDHIKPVAEGGATSDENGQGYCEACNHAKQAPGWQQTPIDSGPGGVETITPTGHRYRSHAPPLPDPACHTDWISEIERHLRLTVDDLVPSP